MKTGIKAREIMEEDFPLLDSSMLLGQCMDLLNKSNWEVCVVMNNGVIHSILDSDDVVREYLRCGDKKIPLKKLNCNSRFAIIKSETDMEEIIEMMKQGVEYFVVKGNPFIGLITKDRVAEKNYLAFKPKPRVE